MPRPPHRRAAPAPETPPHILPLRGSPNVSSYKSPRPARKIILASHLVFHGYGHWLSNDPRGSGSTSTRKDELKDLGDIHFGRKPIQPPREELKRFYRQAESLLDHGTIWFDERMRVVIAEAMGRAAGKHGYTVWACRLLESRARGGADAP